ncbi:MAG: hypothetical protein GY778_30830 [bacterium]|nr:hypothetical protein [bacterium]
MADYPLNPNRRKSDPDSESTQDYAGAMRTIRAARGLFLLLLILSLLLQIGVYCAAHWTQVLEPAQAAQTEIAAPTEGAAPAAAELAQDGNEEFATIYYVLELVMPLSEFVGQISCGALLLCYLLATNVALSGRLGGVRGSVSSFFWMVVLMALLFPWGRWLGDLAGQVQVPGVYATFGEMANLPAEFADRTHQVLHYARHLGFPVLALLIALVGDRKYAKGYRLAQRQIEARLNVRTI